MPVFRLCIIMVIFVKNATLESFWLSLGVFAFVSSFRTHQHKYTFVDEMTTSKTEKMHEQTGTPISPVVVASSPVTRRQRAERRLMRRGWLLRTSTLRSCWWVGNAVEGRRELPLGKCLFALRRQG